jgi:hypothetical protein
MAAGFSFLGGTMQRCEWAGFCDASWKCVAVYSFDRGGTHGDIMGVQHAQ